MSQMKIIQTWAVSIFSVKYNVLKENNKTNKCVTKTRWIRYAIMRPLNEKKNVGQKKIGTKKILGQKQLIKICFVKNKLGH